MINLFFVLHDHSGARTYADQLVSWLENQPDVKVTKVFYQSKHHDEFFTDSELGEIHIPAVKKKERDLCKYSKRCVDLLFPFTVGKENVIFHLNNDIHVKLASEVKLRWNAKIIYTLHFLPDYYSWLAYNQKWDMELTTTGDALELEMVESTDKIITVTRFAKDAVVNLFNIPESKVKAIHNGFTPTTVSNVAQNKDFEKFGFEKKDQVILYAGLIEDRKGVKELVEVFNLVVKKCPHARLVIAGNGDFNGVMGNIGENWGRITFTGKIPYSLLQQLYQIATVGVIPSIFEQCSYVALEMMYYGLPVVVNNAPGLAELYNHCETGWVVPLKSGDTEKLRLAVDIKAFAAGIIEMLKNQPLRQAIAQSSREKWENNYHAERMGIETLNEYRKLIKEKLTRGNGQGAYTPQKVTATCLGPCSITKGGEVTKIKD